MAKGLPITINTLNRVRRHISSTGPQRISPNIEDFDQNSSDYFMRLEYNKIAPTVLASPNPGWKCIHPSVCRWITARECARLQGFPDSFEILSENQSVPLKYRQVGNAVSPPLAKAILLEIMKILKINNKSRVTGSKISQGFIREQNPKFPNLVSQIEESIFCKKPSATDSDPVHMAGQMPPEILFEILSYIPQDPLETPGDFFRFLQINRNWCSVIVSLLWREPFHWRFIQRRQKMVETLLRFLNEQELNDISFNAKVTWIKSARKPFFEYPSFVHTLDLSAMRKTIALWCAESSYDDPYVAQLIINNALMNLFPKVGAFVTTIEDHDKEFPFGAFRSFIAESVDINLPAWLSNITILKLEFRTPSGPEQTMRTFAGKFPNLQTLDISMNITIHDNAGVTADVLELNSFIGQTNSLNCLVIRNFPLGIETLLGVLPVQGISLHHLEFKSVNFENCLSLAPIGACQSLEYLDFDSCSGLTEEMAKPLTSTKFPKLRKVFVHHASWVTSFTPKFTDWACRIRTTLGRSAYWQSRRLSYSYILAKNFPTTEMMRNLTNTLLQDLQKLLENSDTYDVTICVGKDLGHVKNFKAHSLILRARCPYFRRALSNDWKLEEKDGVIYFEKPNIPEIAFKFVLNYIYTGNVSFEKLGGDDVLKLLAAADELELLELIKYGQEFLVDQSFNKIKDSPNLLFESKDFGLLTESTLVSLLKREDLNIPEIQIWESILKWGIEKVTGLNTKKLSEWTEDDFVALETEINECIPLIRYCAISAKDYHEKVLPYKKILPKNIKSEMWTHFLNPNSKPLNLLPARERLKAHRIDSEIISLPHFKVLTTWVNKEDIVLLTSNLKSTYDYKLLYRASRDGFHGDQFRIHCGDKKGTLVVIKVRENGQIIGGYNPNTWGGTTLSAATEKYLFAEDNTTFIFNFGNKGDPRDGKVARVTAGFPSIVYHSSYGPQFFNDLKIFPESETTSRGWYRSQQYKPHIFEVSQGLPQYFTVHDYEVFQVLRK
ncbi:hypothetical protein G9A89_012592 [Geosiphon pyriformis]|nr:hypothetical protein G9A89_012592 [Geosiphon pyriformis]